MARITEKQLRERVSVSTCCNGQFTVTIQFKGKTYQCRSNNTLAYDMRNWEHGDERVYYHSARTALLALYDECKYKNHLA